MPKTQAQPPDPGPIGLSRARGRFMSHVLALVTGNGIAQAVQFSGTLALARLCAPESFGVFALFLTVVSVFSVLGGGRYELAIMLPDSDEEAANILFLATFVVLGIAGVGALALPFLHGSLDRLFDVQERQRFSLVLEVLGNVASLGGLYLTLWLTRDTVLAVGVFAGLEAIYTLTWLWFVYRVAGFHRAGLLLVGKDVLVWGGITAVALGAMHSVFHPWTAFLASFFVVFLIEAACAVRSVRGDRLTEATAWLRALRARPTTPAA